MYIREIIQRRFESETPVYDRQGERVPEQKLKAEYRTIRQYLLDHYVGSSVAIALNKDYHYILTILACQEIGITYIPMKHDYPADRIGQIQEDSDFKLLITDSKLEEILTYKEVKRTELPAVSPEQIAYIIFTSGSTGRPKGVIIQRQGLNNFYHWIDTYLTKIGSQDRLLQVTEFTFDISLVDVGLFLTRGLHIYFSQFVGNIFRLGYEVETYRISALNTVPNNLNMFLSDLVAERMDYKCLKHLMIGGARFSYGLFEKCKHYFPENIDVHNLYGPTEATVYCHVNTLTFNEETDCQDKNISIGKPMPNVLAMILKDGKAAAPFERGELLLGGIQLLKEYCNNPGQTEKALMNFEGVRYYKSGDLSFVDDKGNYYIVGRNDDTIKYRGFRINLLDIDSYITRIPYVQDSVTVAIEDANNDNQTIGFIILKETKTAKELKKDLGSILLDYQIPEKIIFVDKYPTNTSGKVCRKTLKSDYLAKASV